VTAQGEPKPRAPNLICAVMQDHLGLSIRMKYGPEPRMIPSCSPAGFQDGRYAQGATMTSEEPAYSWRALVRVANPHQTLLDMRIAPRIDYWACAWRWVAGASLHQIAILGGFVKRP